MIYPFYPEQKNCFWRNLKNKSRAVRDSGKSRYPALTYVKGCPRDYDGFLREKMRWTKKSSSLFLKSGWKMLKNWSNAQKFFLFAIELEQLNGEKKIYHVISVLWKQKLFSKVKFLSFCTLFINWEINLLFISFKVYIFLTITRVVIL